MRTALITGTSGFVGGAIGQHLRALGWHVTGLSRSPSRAGASDQDLRHDLRMPLPSDLPRHDAVVHAAALSSPWAPPEAFTANVVNATANIADYVERTGPERFIHISTGAIFYTSGDQLGITESSALPEKAINEYARAKRQAEEVIGARCPSAIIIRPRAVYGPGDTVLFPRILRAARKGLFPKIVRPDGVSPRADLIYIGNLCHMVQMAIEREVAGAFNVTDGAPVEIQVMLADVFARLGYPQPRLRLPAGPLMLLAGGMEWASAHLFGWREPPLTRFGISAISHSKTFDVSRMIAHLGPPRFTTEEGISAFVDWQHGQWEGGTQ